MPTWEEVENLVKSESEAFALKLSQAASGNPTEQTFRDRLVPLIADFCKKAGVAFAPKGGYTLISGGKPDTVFNRLVVEYKAPGTLRGSNTHPNNADAITQLRGYLDDIAKEEKHLAERLAGVILDGYYLIFVRKFGTRWHEDDPSPATADSIARFLRYLVSLSCGVALTADNLVKDFGIEQAPAHEMIAALESAIRTSSHPLVQKLFEQWQTFFSEVIEYKEAFTDVKFKDLQRFAGKAGIDLEKDEQTAKRFFFAIHTYFALLVKLLAWLALYRNIGGKLGVPSFGRLSTLSSVELIEQLKKMENGDLFREYWQITNLLEGDFFSWYLYAWNNRIENALRAVLAKLDSYDPTTLELDPEATRDLLKKLYHYLMPREIRHNLGEYYTPDWLAQVLLERVDSAFFTDDPEKSNYVRENLLKLRFLDPGCGSGTFLVLIIKRIKEAAKKLLIPEGEVLNAILENVVGFDLNPLAVIAARTNYLLALGELLEYRQGQEVRIPVYLADSIMPPKRGKGLEEWKIFPAKTAVGIFNLPQEVVTKERIDKLCEVLERAVKADILPEVFLEDIKQRLGLSDQEFSEAKPALIELYQKFSNLERQHLNGIWARIIKNAFAPNFMERFDYIVGNPPWVNWENLPDGYRKDSADLWSKHNLFPHKGYEAILGKAKDDISILMTYTAVDRYLKDSGKLGFLITQSVFKTAGAGQGFRRFTLGDGTPIKVLHVDDMVELQPFEGASNRTSLVVLQKGKPTTYPVPYTYWQKAGKGKIGFDSKLEGVMSLVKRRKFVAEPVNEKDKTSAWLTGRPGALRAIKKVLGKSDYEAHAGVNTGGANAVYWLEILDRRPDGLVLVANITEGQKREVPKIAPTAIESDLLYPLLRGRDVKRWQAQPSAWILMTHLPGMRLKAMPEKEMQLHYPKTWSYLKQFEAVLRSRAAYKRYFRENAPFYSMFDVGDYTFAPYKVVWARIASSIEASVIERNVVPQETLSIVVTKTTEEAHYLSAMLNCSPFNFAVVSYSQTGGKSFGSPHIIENIRIPKFDSQNPVHLRLAQLSEKAHELARTNKALSEVEEEIDRPAAELWGLADEELAEIKRSLAEVS